MTCKQRRKFGYWFRQHFGGARSEHAKTHQTKHKSNTIQCTRNDNNIKSNVPKMNNMTACKNNGWQNFVNLYICNARTTGEAEHQDARRLLILSCEYVHVLSASSFSMCASAVTKFYDEWQMKQAIAEEQPLSDNFPLKGSWKFFWRFCTKCVFGIVALQSIIHVVLLHHAGRFKAIKTQFQSHCACSPQLCSWRHLSCHQASEISTYPEAMGKQTVQQPVFWWHRRVLKKFLTI